MCNFRCSSLCGARCTHNDFFAVHGNFDRSMIAPDPTADTDGFKFVLADPTTGSCSLEPTSGTVPAAGAACTVQGSVAWNIQKWFEDSSDWVLYCDESNTWTNVGKAKKKSTLETFDAGKNWIRIDVDTTNKNLGNTPDVPTSWLAGNASVLPELNQKCSDAPLSNWGAGGGSLYICTAAMTNEQIFVGIICTQGVSNDTPDCGGTSITLNPSSMSEMSTNCPLKPRLFD